MKPVSPFIVIFLSFFNGVYILTWTPKSFENTMLFFITELCLFIFFILNWKAIRRKENERSNNRRDNEL